MRLLFDQRTPAPLRQLVLGHEVETAYKRGWSSLQNGELIAAAEATGFDVFVTTDNWQQPYASAKSCQEAYGCCCFTDHQLAAYQSIT